jgi:hypothetical protein
MTVQSIRGIVEGAIQRASAATGVDFTFLMGTARRESGGNPAARAGASSAGGLFQFVDQTWLSTLKAHGAKYGYARYADLIQKGADGRYHVQDAEAKKAVMALKLDPHAASLMAGELTSDHAAYLRGRVGRNPTAGELYAAHFLGPQGSAKLIETVQSNPGASAVSLFPDAAGANRSIFYREGQPVTVAQLYGALTRSTAGDAPAPVSNPRDDQAFVSYAAARHDERAREQSLVQLILRGRVDPGDSLGLESSTLGGGGARVTGSLFTSEMLRVLSDASDKR